MDHPQFDVGEKPFGPEQDGGPYYEEPKKHRGCLFYGCVTAIVLSVFALIAVAAGLYSLYYFVNKTVTEYTSTTPVPIPKVTFTDEQRKERDDRWEAFKQAVKKGETTEIVLDSDDINALISEKDEVKDKIYVTLEGDQIKGQVSIPLDDLGIPLLPKGRYFNGNASLTAKMTDGQLDVRLKALDVNGKTMPPNVAQQFANQNLAKDVRFDGEQGATMRKIDKMVIKDGKLIIKANVKEEEEKPAEATKTEATKAEEPAAAPKEEAKPAEEPKDKPEPAGVPKAA